MRLLLGLFLMGIVMSCGQDPSAGDRIADNGSPLAEEIIEGELTAESLAKEFAESGIDLELSDLSDNVRIFLIDAPIDIDAKSVTVTIDELGIHRKGSGDAEGEWIRVDMGKKEFDLMALRDGPSDVLGDITLDPGEYNLLRLKVTEGQIEMQNGDIHSLCIPENGRKNHIQMNIDLNVAEEATDESEIDEELSAIENVDADAEVDVVEESYGVVVDFDALESIQEYKNTDQDITDATCTYVLRPVLKLNRAAKLLKAKRKHKRRAEHMKNRLERAKERFRNRLRDGRPGTDSDRAESDRAEGDVTDENTDTNNTDENTDA